MLRVGKVGAVATLLALMFVSASVAAAATFGAGAQAKVPAPAVGAMRLEMLTITVKGKTATPKLKATNLAKLGKGFGGVALVSRTPNAKGAYQALVVMYMGNLSASPASTVNLQISTPAGETTTKTTDVTTSCSAWDTAAELNKAAWVVDVLFTGDSNWIDWVKGLVQAGKGKYHCK